MLGQQAPWLCLHLVRLGAGVCDGSQVREHPFAQLPRHCCRLLLLLLHGCCQPHRVHRQRARPGAPHHHKRGLAGKTLWARSKQEAGVMWLLAHALVV